MSAPPNVTERVRFIREIMLSNEWITGVTGPRLAAEWGFSEGTIKHYAAEASRSIREALDINAVRVRATSLVDEAVEMAREAATANPLDRTKAAQVLLGAAATLGKIAGREAAPKPREPGSTLDEWMEEDFGAHTELAKVLRAEDAAERARS